MPRQSPAKKKQAASAARKPAPAVQVLLADETDLGVFPPAVVAVINRKGGVGKTSFCFQAGGLFARAGKRVLLIDFDPQASLTQGCLGSEESLSLPAAATVASLFSPHGLASASQIVRATAFDGMSLAPCSEALNDYDRRRLDEPGRLAFSLKEFVQEQKRRFDLVLIDCRPTLNFLSWCALLAADGVVVPVQPEDYGSQGLIHVQHLINQAAQGDNPGLRLLGFLLTMVRPRLSVHVAYDQQLRAEYGTAVFQAVIPDLKDYKESITMQQPVCHYRPKGQATKATRAVALELVARLRGEQPASPAPKEDPEA